DLSARDIGSRDSIHQLAGVTWQAIDYADGLVRVGVQSAIPHPETAALLRRLMEERGLPVPPEGRTLDSICITAVRQPGFQPYRGLRDSSTIRHAGGRARDSRPQCFLRARRCRDRG